LDDPETLKREMRALKEAKSEHGADRLLILTAESRVPFPAVADSIQVLHAWQWMLETGTE